MQMASTAQQTATAPAPPKSGEDQSAFFAWIEKHRKPLGYVIGAVAIVAVGGWLLLETGRRKQVAASDALDRARAAYESGNLPTASSEFQRIIQAYRGTDAAQQAELGLNDVRLASGQAQLAVDELRKFAESNPPPTYASGAWFMMGGALENLKKYDEAAAAYLKAAELAPEDYRKVDAFLGAARAYRVAGKSNEVLNVLRGVLSKFPKDTPGVAEAQVRLAELTKGVM